MALRKDVVQFMETISSRIVMPSVNMLPIDEIKVALDGAIQALDTDFVGGVDASQIAVAYNNDREAVRTAYYLGDRPAEEYLTIEADPTSTIKSLGKKQQNEITGLRLELYRLYEILNKQLGAVYKPESGYLEDFSETIAVSTTADVTNPESNILKIRPLDANFAIPKEFIVIDDGEEQHVAQIASVSEGVYTITGAINSAIRAVTLYKIKGEMLNNTYSFSRTLNNVLSDTAHSVVLGDYAATSYQAIGKGVATNLQIRSNMLAIDGDRDKAVLSGVRAHVSRKSAQASSQVICKIYNIKRNGEDFTLELLGTSTSEDITYSRWVNFKVTNNGQPLEVSADQELLVAFECNTDNNSFEIKMGEGANGTDLHTNRAIYNKTDAGYKIDSSINKDILLGLDFSGYIAKTTEPYKKGLYTSRTFINEREDNRLVQLQVKFKNIIKTSVKGATPVNGAEGFVADQELNGSGTMVVGNNIASYSKAVNNTIFTNEPIAVYPNDDVYFIPVVAQIISTNELFDAYTVSQVTEMLPVRVCGDYVIFECTLPEHVKRFNTQIAYNDNGNKQAAALESIIVSLI